MKILVDNYTTMHNPAAKFDEDSVVTFLTGSGDQFRVTANKTFDGIRVSVVRKQGGDQLNIRPEVSNSVEIE